MSFGQFGQSEGSLILLFVCEVNIVSHLNNEPHVDPISIHTTSPPPKKASAHSRKEQSVNSPSSPLLGVSL